MNKKSLDQLLEEVDVLSPGMWYNELSSTEMSGWWVVCTAEGIVAYFCNENDANRFRLDYVNRILNP